MNINIPYWTVALLGAIVGAGILIVVFLIVPLSFQYSNQTNALGSISSALIALSVALYGIFQFDRHIKEKKTEILAIYNQRYSTDKNIEKVVRWIIDNLDDNGKLKTVDPCEKNDIPGIYEKELFMRFFEEMYLQISQGKINKEDAKRLFSYYALKFNEYDRFHSDITDYGSEDWHYYNKFICMMKCEKK